MTYRQLVEKELEKSGELVYFKFRRVSRNYKKVYIASYCYEGGEMREIVLKEKILLKLKERG